MADVHKDGSNTRFVHDTEDFGEAQHGFHSNYLICVINRRHQGIDDCGRISVPRVSFEEQSICTHTCWFALHH